MKLNIKVACITIAATGTIMYLYKRLTSRKKIEEVKSKSIHVTDTMTAIPDTPHEKLIARKRTTKD